ncbi:unnamed protein product [Ectocarpus fasciculatus]
MYSFTTLGTRGLGDGDSKSEAEERHHTAYPTAYHLSQARWTKGSHVAYSSPIPPQFYGPLAAVFVVAGLAFMSVSFMQQMSARKEQSAAKDLPLALTSSAFLGFGALFVLLWSGVYV